MGLNEFSDMSEDDFESLLPKIDYTEDDQGFLNTEKYPQVEYTATDDDNLPEPINWVEKGYVTSVKQTDQDCLVASYAFAAADTVEALYKDQTGNLVELSTK